jgi:hypothetical protein
MPYVPTNWTDEVPATTPVKYRISQASSGDVATDATIELVTSVIPGTPLNAENMNKQEDAILLAVETAEAAEVAVESKIPKSLVTIVGDLIYATASATLARLAKPTLSLAKLLMTSSGVPSWGALKQVVQIQLVVEGINVDTTTVGYFFIPSSMNNMVLERAQAIVLTAGVTNPTTIQVRNLTKYASNDALSTAISIASSGTVGTPGTVNAAYAYVSTNDKIKIYVTAASTTKPQGLFIILEYTLP